MLNSISEELRYFGLNRVVDIRNGEVSWTTILELSGHILFYGTGASPTAALQNVVSKALEDKNSPTLTTTLSLDQLGLDQLADDLLQLMLRRSDGVSNAGAQWSAVGHFRRQRTFWIFGSRNRPSTIQVTGSSPDEVLNEVIQRNSGK
jgi:hypothetical protein